MEWRHELYIGSIEVSNFVFEVFDQFEGRKFHNEMLDSPLSVFLRNLVPAVHYLRVDIAAHVDQKLDHTYKPFLKFKKLVHSFLLNIGLAADLGSIFVSLVQPMLLKSCSKFPNYLLKIARSLFRKALDKI